MSTELESKVAVLEDARKQAEDNQSKILDKLNAIHTDVAVIKANDDRTNTRLKQIETNQVTRVEFAELKASTKSQVANLWKVMAVLFVVIAGAALKQLGIIK